MVKTSGQRGRRKGRGEAYGVLSVEPLGEMRTTRAGVFNILLTGIAVKPDDELHRTLSRAAAAAGAHDLGFPVGLFLIEPAKGFPAFRDGRPGLVGAGEMGDETTGRDRHLAMLRWFALRHAEAARLLGRRWKFRWGLGGALRRS